MLFDILHAYGYETAIYSAQDENWLGMRRFIESNNAKIDNFKHALDFKQYYQFFDGKIDDATSAVRREVNEQIQKTRLLIDDVQIDVRKTEAHLEADARGDGVPSDGDAVVKQNSRARAEPKLRQKHRHSRGSS